MNARMRAFPYFRRQLGLITRAQAREAGLSDTTIARALRCGDWQRRQPGVFAHAAAPRTREQAVLAAALWVGPSGLVAGATAMELAGLGARSPDLHVLVPRSVRRRSAGVRVHRTDVLHRLDRDRIGAIPVTSAARTLADVAAGLSTPVLERALEEALRRRLTTLPRLLAVHERLSGSGHAGCRRLRHLLEARTVDWVALQHELERRTWQILRRAPLPEPRRQHAVETGRFVAHLDFAWPEEMVALEVDGWGPHHGRRAHHRDRERWSELTALGWRLQVVGWDHVVGEPKRLVERLGALLCVHGPVV